MRFQDPKVERRKDVQRQYWFVRPVVPVVSPDGQVIRKNKVIRLGWCDEMTATKAKQAKQEVMAAINGGHTILQAQIPFRAVVEKFLAARVPQLGRATQAKYRQHIGRHILPDLGRLEIAEVDAPTVQAWLNAKRAAGLSSATCRDLRNIVSVIFSQAIAWRMWSSENPCQRVTVEGRTEAREKRLLTAEELHRLLDGLRECRTVAEATTGADVALMILIALTAGLRISEVLGLQWRDLDLDHGTLRVERRWWRGDVDAPKSEKSRRVRQIGSLVDDLAAHKPGDAQSEAWVFPSLEGHPPDDRNLNQHILRPVAVDLGIYWPGFGFHTFRRQNISWRQEAGAHVFEAQKAAGHARPSTTWDYTLIDARRERSQVERILGRVRKMRQKVVKIG